uniref:Secreted protein n=1 Tax=Arundo donax TaxID=35708 RepID=A0A0A9A0Q6_ARUDO
MCKSFCVHVMIVQIVLFPPYVSAELYPWPFSPTWKKATCPKFHQYKFIIKFHVLVGVYEQTRIMAARLLKAYNLW